MRAFFLLILLLGAALRMGMLARDVRFHPDEALYATYARRMSYYGDLLFRDVALDKPPLGIAITALSFSIWGPSEFAARLPTVFASLLSLAALAALAHHLFGVHVALLAVLLYALSPFDLAFAATGFHDPPLTLFLLLTCLAAARDRWTAAGIFAACAIAVKQSAVQFLPVFLAVGLGAALCACWRGRDYERRLVQFGLPVVACALGLAAWSAIRAAPVDFWTLGIANPGLLRFTRPDEILPRLRRWLDLLRYAVGFAPLLAFGVLAPMLVRRHSPRRAMLIVLVAAGVLATLLLYWIVASNTYDRYVHPLVPLALLLVAVGISTLSRQLAHRWRYALPLASILLMLPWTASALRGELPIGGDHGEHAEIRALAAAINALPQGAVVYDYWLGWELGFYLGLSSPARVEFQPSPESFGRAVCDRAEPSYLVAPAGVERRWLHEAEARGATVALVSGERLRLYELTCP